MQRSIGYNGKIYHLYYLLIRSKCPYGSRRKQIPVILCLKEIAKCLPAPINAYNTILNIFCKSSLQWFCNLPNEQASKKLSYVRNFMISKSTRAKYKLDGFLPWLFYFSCWVFQQNISLMKTLPLFHRMRQQDRLPTIEAKHVY